MRPLKQLFKKKTTSNDFDIYTKLDLVLKLLVEQSHRTTKSLLPNNILAYLKGKEAGINISDAEFEMILEQLIADGYIIKINEEYKITLTGLIFSQKDGYRERETNRALLSALPSEQKNIASRISWLTAVLVVEGLTAAIYYLIEILKFYGFFGCH